MLTFLIILWFIWELKYVLFWLYLWQLKEYHTGRFLDHFGTHRGRGLVYSFEQVLKFVVLLFLTFTSGFFNFLVSLLYIIYIVEAALFARAILNRSAKKPVLTFKAAFLTAVSFLLLVGFSIWLMPFSDLAQVSWLLIFDLFTCMAVSMVVLFFQPFFVTVRLNRLVKAKEKLENMRSKSKLCVVAVTGSYGKTTTKEFLATILSKKFKILNTEKHQNSEIGVANCILNKLKPEHQVFVAEVGAYNKGKVYEVCSMLRPDIGIITGINEQHLSLFGSMKNLLSGEGGEELAQFLKNKGMLVVNGDNKYCLDLYKKFDGNKKVYSQSGDKINADIWADSITVYKDRVSFISRNKKGEIAHFNVKVLGGQNVQNLLGAILIAKELGMSLSEISEACHNIKQEQAGMVLRRGKHGLNIIDSSYSANPDGVIAALDFLKIFTRKRIIVMPCLIELGRKSSEIHYNLGKKIAEVCDLAIITSKDRFKDIKAGADSVFSENGGKGLDRVVFVEKPEDICSLITIFCKSGDTVLLEGRVPQKLHEIF